MSMLEELYSTFYKIKAKQEASRREGLDIQFDEIQAPPELISNILNALFSQIEPVFEAGSWFPFGVKITQRESALKNVAWLLREGRLIGVWDFDKGTILYWEPKLDLFEPKQPNPFDPRAQ